jgi:hypothetical protein
MPQLQTPSKQKSGTLERAKEIAPDAAKLVTAAGITGYTAVKGLNRKFAIDDAIAKAAEKAKLADPRFDPTTGKKLPLTSPVRAQQTADFTQAIKRPVLLQEATAAVGREKARLAKPSRFSRIKANLQNIRASMGGGQPAPSQAPATLRSAASNVRPAYKDVRANMEAANDMRGVRNAVGDMLDVGRRGSSILNSEIHPALTKVADVVKKGGKFGGKVVGYGALPLSLGMNFLAKKEAESFAQAQAGKSATGKPLPPTDAQKLAAATKAQKAAPKAAHTPTDTYNIGTKYDSILTEIEKGDYGDNTAQEIWNRLRPELEKNPAFLSAFENDPAFASARKELGYRKK